MFAKYFIIGSFFLVLASISYGFDHSHALWTQVLKKYRTDDGFVRYSQLRADVTNPQHEFLIYLDSLQKVTNSEYLSWPKLNQMAFLINAYNAFTVKLVIDHYPLSSITDIGGWFWKINKKPWKMEFFHLLEDKIKSLDPIEHEYLRNDKFSDYRIHSALNCASYSCPLLRFEAYVGEQIDKQLDEQMLLWFADNERTKFDLTKNKVYLSKIIDWYKEDFTKWGGSIHEILKKFAPENMKLLLSSSIDIEYLDYNWDLNDAKERRK